MGAQERAGRGRLVYVMGASGVGKDSLLAAARRRHPEWLVAHRYITRASSESEDCVSLTSKEFAWRRQSGLFCLDWRAHGFDYAIGIEVRAWLERGGTVIVNGSRRALSLAETHFPADLLPVLVTACPEILRERLLLRGRESHEEIEARLERHRHMEFACPSAHRLDNSGTLGETLTALETLLAPEGVS